MEKSDTIRLRGGGRGAYDIAGPRMFKPPVRELEVLKQTRWEEMNRRQRIHEYFNNAATPQTDHQKDLLDRAKSNEEQRRLRWDNNWKERHLATPTADNMDAALPKTSFDTFLKVVYFIQETVGLLHINVFYT